MTTPTADQLSYQTNPNQALVQPKTRGPVWLSPESRSAP
jgi:hypothetical protein